MSKVLVTESYLTDIGNAIRAKNKSTTKYKPSEMAEAISSINPAVVVNSDSAWKYSITQKEHENITVNVMGVTLGDNTSGYKTNLIFTPSISTSYGYNAGIIRKTADEENHVAHFTADDATPIDGLIKDGWAGIYCYAPSNSTDSYSYFSDYNNPTSSLVDQNSNIENLLILGYYKEDSNGELVARTENNLASYNPSSEDKLIKYQNKYATKVGDAVFNNCSALTSVDIPNATSIGDSAFSNCYALKSVDLHNATTIGNSAFYTCYALTSVDIPNATSIGGSAFSNCASLTSVDFPNATSIGDFAFSNCSALTSVDFPNATSIGDSAFSNCSKLKTIYLRSKTMCTCLGDLGFSPFSSPPTIYVPNSLIDSYKTADNWSEYASFFKSLESIELSKISIIGKNINTYNGNTTGTYKVQYNDGDVLPEQVGVTWSITGNATISQDGIVTLKNASVGDKLTITATSTYNTSISASLTVSVINVVVSMTVDLNNGQWVDSGTTIDGHTVYKSDAGSYHVNNGKSTCTVTVKGYNNVTVYARSYAERNYDYVDVGPLDGKVTRAAASNVLSTKDNQSSRTYLAYTFTISDAGTHTFQVLYSKDSSGNNDDDRGYFYVVCQ